MSGLIEGFGMLWMVFGLLAGGGGIVLAIAVQPDYFVSGIGTGLLMVSIGIIMQGFAVIVRYFERALAAMERKAAKRGD